MRSAPPAVVSNATRAESAGLPTREGAPLAYRGAVGKAGDGFAAPIGRKRKIDQFRAVADFQARSAAGSVDTVDTCYAEKSSFPKIGFSGSSTMRKGDRFDRA
jgi:hypothetical protein